jgi:hypothetical protein
MPQLLLTSSIRRKDLTADQVRTTRTVWMFSSPSLQSGATTAMRTALRRRSGITKAAAVVGEIAPGARTVMLLAATDTSVSEHTVAHGRGVTGATEPMPKRITVAMIVNLLRHLVNNDC